MRKGKELQIVFIILEKTNKYIWSWYPTFKNASLLKSQFDDEYEDKEMEFAFYEIEHKINNDFEFSTIEDVEKDIVEKLQNNSFYEIWQASEIEENFNISLIKEDVKNLKLISKNIYNKKENISDDDNGTDIFEVGKLYFE